VEREKESNVITPELTQAWKEVKQQLPFILNTECNELTKMSRDTLKAIKEQYVLALNFIKKLKEFPEDSSVIEFDELTKIIVFLYYYCIINDIQSLCYLNEFTLTCSNHQVMTSIMMPIFEIIEERLQVQDIKEIMAEDRYRLIQTLIIFTSFCQSEPKKYNKEISSVYHLLIQILALLAIIPNLQLMSELPSLKEQHWVTEKKDLKVSILGNFKNLPYICLNECLVMLRYATLYYSYRITRIIMTTTIFIDYEIIVEMLFDILIRNSSRVETCNDELKDDILLGILNENYIALKFIVVIFRHTGRSLNEKKQALNNKFKDIITSTFNCYSKAYTRRMISNNGILRLLKSLFNLKREVKGSNHFLDKVIINFYEINANSKVIDNTTLLNHISNYFLHNTLHIEQLIEFLNEDSKLTEEDKLRNGIVKVVKVANSNTKCMQAVLNYFLEEIKHPKTEEILKFIIEIILAILTTKYIEMEVIKLILEHPYDQSYESILLSFVKSLLNNAIEKTKKRNWSLKQKNVYIPNTIIKTLNGVIENGAENSFQRKVCYMLIDYVTSLLVSCKKHSQEIIFYSVEWKRLIKSLNSKRFTLDRAAFIKKVLEFMKHLIYDNDNIKTCIKEFKDIADSICEFVLSIPDIKEDTLDSIFHSLIEIAFESYPTHTSYIENPLFFEISMRLLNDFSTKGFEGLITRYLQLIAKVTPGPYNNYKILSSVVLQFNVIGNYIQFIT